MGLIDEATGLAKTAVELAKAQGTKDLLAILIDLQIKTLELTADNRELRRELADVKEKLEFQGSLQYRDNLYWTGPGNSEREGPYCPTCWDSKKLALRMERRPVNSTVWCQNCQHSIKFGPEENWSDYRR